MSYNYEQEKQFVFTDAGQRALLKIRDKAFELCSVAGCVRADKLMCVSGDSWTTMACIDRLVELADLKVLLETSPWQHRVFGRTRE